MNVLSFVSCAIYGSLSFIFMQEPYSKDWDDRLNKLIDNNCIEFDSKDKLSRQHIAVVANDDKVTGVWVSNFPYSYGHAFYGGDNEQIPEYEMFRPSIFTIYRLRCLQISDFKNKQKESAKKWADQQTEIKE